MDKFTSYRDTVADESEEETETIKRVRKRRPKQGESSGRLSNTKKEAQTTRGRDATAKAQQEAGLQESKPNYAFSFEPLDIAVPFADPATPDEVYMNLTYLLNQPAEVFNRMQAELRKRLPDI